MTTFSRVLLNPARRDGRRLLSNPQAMHAAVRASLPPDVDGRILWRTDQAGHERSLYIVAPEAPDLRVLVEQAGWETRPGESADYQKLLDRLADGQEWSFRLVANPVRSVPNRDDGARRGTVTPHTTVAQQEQWLIDQGARHGFEVTSVLVSGREDMSFGRHDPHHDRRSTVKLRAVRFDGTLRVTDADALRIAMAEGIGRGKAYGCGLLTLARR